MPIDIASGAVHLEYEDVFIPGKLDLVWERSYNTEFLARQGTHLGQGWTCRYFSALTKKSDRFEFVKPDGSIEDLPDPDGIVAQGGTVRHIGAFLEIFQKSGRYIVQSWDVESGEIWRYCFAPEASGQPMPLLCIEDVTGQQGLDLIRDDRGRIISIRQRLEKRALLLEYSGGDLIRTVSLCGANGERQRLMRYEYDFAGRMSAVFNALDNADRYEYDHKDRLTREIAKHGGVFSYRYDNKGRCVWYSGLDRYDEKRLRFLDAAHFTELTDSYGATTRYRYLPSGQIVSEWNPLGAETKTAYDDDGRIISKTTPTGATTHYEYDEQGNRSKIVDPLGNASEFEFNHNHQPTILTDPNGNLWRRHYDERNRISTTIDPVEARWTLQYDENGNLIVLINPKGHSRTFRYVSGVLMEDTDWNGNPTHVEFDAFGRLSVETDPLGNTTRYSYDAVGNLVSVLLPDKAQIQAAYDSGGDLVRLVDPVGRVTTRRFGPCRRLLERVDPNGNKISYTWGTEPDRLEQVINEREEIYQLFYNDAGYCTREVSFDGREYQFAYDPLGWCIKTTNGAGETISIGRDPLGRIVSQALPNGDLASYAYDKLGNLSEAINSECDIRLERDIVGRLVREIQGDHWVNYSHDKLGEVTRMETDLGLQVDYELAPNGFWKGLHTSDGHVMQFSRDAVGREVERQLPGGLKLDMHYDPLGRLVEQRLARRGSGSFDASGWTQPTIRTLVHRSYALDASGLVQEIDDQYSGKTRYAYDPGERLLQVMKERGLDERFEHDVAGNLTRAVTEWKDRVEDEVFVYGAGNRLLNKGAIRYEYDAQGRLVCKAEGADTANPKNWRYEWDALDQLRSVIRSDGEVWRYGYDALGRRVRKNGPDDEVRFVWYGNVPVHELSGNGEDCRSWLFEQHSFIPLAQLKKGSIYSVITDHLGTPQEMVDSFGQIVWRLRSKAYGEKVFEGMGDISCPFRFQGQYFDCESGLHYNRFRYFDPDIGRFISQDPIGLVGGNNLYQYASNPIEWIDPLGLVNAPSTLPNEEGIYIVRNGSQSYVGQAGMGSGGGTFKQGMNDRLSSSSDPGQALLGTGQKVQFVRVNLGAATDVSERNNILRYYEAREYDKEKAAGQIMLNKNRPQDVSKTKTAEALIGKRGASASGRRSTCK
jgi:RHS repeat-associated protein